jgi:hypothetical protein
MSFPFDCAAPPGFSALQKERDMPDYWFNPKTHGYGAYPTDWRGWALILGVVFLNFLLAAVLLVWPTLTGAPIFPTRFVLFLILDTLLVVGLLNAVRKKTDGDWRWRWGKTEQRQ